MYQELYRGNIAFGNGFSFVSISNHEGLCPMLLFPMSISLQENDKSIVGSVVECSPATRAARVRFPDDALLIVLFCFAHYDGFGEEC